MFLAQIQEEPRLRSAANDLIHDGQSVIFRAGALDASIAPEDDGLHRAGTIDQGNFGGLRRSRRRKFVGGFRCAGPAAEIFFNQRLAFRRP